LRKVTMRVTDDLAHVRVVAVGQLGLHGAQQIDDPSTTRVTRRFPIAVFLTDSFRFR